MKYSNEKVVENIFLDSGNVFVKNSTSFENQNEKTKEGLWRVIWNAQDEIERNKEELPSLEKFLIKYMLGVESEVEEVKNILVHSWHLPRYGFCLEFMDAKTRGSGLSYKIGH